MTSLIGRNPAAIAVVGAALLIIGLVLHSQLMPWIGGVLLVVGGVQTAIGWQRRSPGGGKDEGRTPR